MPREKDIFVFWNFSRFFVLVHEPRTRITFDSSKFDHAGEGRLISRELDHKIAETKCVFVNFRILCVLKLSFESFEILKSQH